MRDREVSFDGQYYYVATMLEKGVGTMGTILEEDHQRAF